MKPDWSLIVALVFGLGSTALILKGIATADIVLVGLAGVGLAASARIFRAGATARREADLAARFTADVRRGARVVAPQ